ncbi:MAG: hypothetical protein IJ861_09055 [Clostridia bacterium]|nr:hypothetical protein [Clostridia bacterium]
MWLVLILQNIKNFIRTKPVLFFFIIISQVVCVIATFAVSGMMDAITPVPKDERGFSQKTFYIPLSRQSEADQDSDVEYIEIFDYKEKRYLYTGEANEEARKIADESPNEIEIVSYSKKASNESSYQEIKSKIQDILKTANGEISFFSIGGHIDNINIIANGDDTWASVNKSNNKAAVSRNPYEDSPYKNLKAGDKITLGKTEYTISEITDRTSIPLTTGTKFEIMYSAIDDNFKIEWMSLTIKDDTDQAGIAKITKAITDAFGDLGSELEVPEPQPLLEKQFNNMIYVLSFIMIAVIILNISRLYTYIMSTRKRSLAIFSVCGASRLKIFTIYIAEIFMTLILSFVIGCVLFQFGLIGIISIVYPSFAEFFTPYIYLTVFGMYMGAGVMIMTANIVPTVNKSITVLTKGGE